MDEVRAFIAIALPDDTIQSIQELQNKLKSPRLKVRWVAPANIHLTLKFLGNISRSSIPNIQEEIEFAAIEIAPFKLGVAGLGVFPDTSRVQVVWAGINGELEKLVTLQKKIDLGLQELGFAPESRPFTAHLTLARVQDKASDTDRGFIGKLAETTKFSAPEFTVRSFSLIQSQLTRTGPVYTCLVSVPLG